MAIAIKPNEFDFSRFKTYQICPRKHDYRYEEGIVSEDNKYTGPGRMFHRCIELIRTQPVGFKKELEQIYDEFDQACIDGVYTNAPGTLKYVVDNYIQYYAKELAAEKLLMCEQGFSDATGDDIICGTIDQVYEKDGVTVLRDIKTTSGKLKYTYEDVQYNQQLLFYVAFAEDIQPIIINAIEIDEVRLAQLKSVPLLKNGKPSKDKKELELVTLDAYVSEIKTQGLPMTEYMSVIEWMEERGHPLFRRTQVQLTDRVVIQTNMRDMLHTYEQIKSKKGSYRCIGPLCNYCDYKRLCDIDRFSPTDSDRKIYIEEITKNA